MSLFRQNQAAHNPLKIISNFSLGVIQQLCIEIKERRFGSISNKASSRMNDPEGPKTRTEH